MHADERGIEWNAKQCRGVELGTTKRWSEERITDHTSGQYGNTSESGLRPRRERICSTCNGSDFEEVEACLKEIRNGAD